MTDNVRLACSSAVILEVPNASSIRSRCPGRARDCRPGVRRPPTNAQKCEAAKIKAAPKKEFCLGAAQAKQALGGTVDTSKCATAFSRAFTSAEARFGVACPTTGDAALIEQRVDIEQAGTAQYLAGDGRFHDNGDGTITDAETGLMWEKKSSDGSLHDQGNTYTWSTNDADPQWTLFTSFLAGLNAGSGFAGHTDWRIPTI